MKEYHLVDAVARELEQIFEWTILAFGFKQAEVYINKTIAQCSAISQGTAHSQSCRQLIGPELKTNLRFARVGRHYIIFVETASRTEILDFVHQSRDVTMWVEL